VARWTGTRDATQYGPSCPQPPGTPFTPPPPFSEDCLFLNVQTPALRPDARRPVLVWIHGGGFTLDSGRDYVGSDLAAGGTVVVTINYRLGALGFLAHPALASRPGGPAGNYGLMDQQAALRWVQRNISRFGGDPRNVTIAGESAGGTAVLEHMVSAGSRGLFQRTIVQSGAFALNQHSLSTEENFGKTFAAQVGCPDQSAACLRQVGVDTLVGDYPPPQAIPGYVDGSVLTEPIGAAFAGGRFTRVPIINGTNTDEELVFVAGQDRAIARGTNVAVPAAPTAENYQSLIATILAVSPARAAQIAAVYPVSAYPAPFVALSALLGDAGFVCGAVQVDTWTAAARMPTYAYEFRDDTAPQIFAGPKFPPVATHGSELRYLFDIPNAPYATTLNPGQETLATSMRRAWANLAARGNPSSPTMRWPAYGAVLTLNQPAPHINTAFAAQHHCSFWGVR
jgi:para-nitrobenzyl esterase